MASSPWAVALALTLLLVACVPQPEPPIKIAGLFGLTGYVAPVGEESRNGFLMAIEDSGMNVSYEILDYQSSTEAVATAANALIDNGAIAIIGPEWNEFGIVVAPISQERRVFFVSPWMTDEASWVQSSPYYLSATGSDRNALRTILQYLDDHHMDRVIVISSENTFSANYVELFRQEIRNHPGMGVIGEFRIPEGTTVFDREMTKLSSLHPDAILAVVATDESQIALNHALNASRIQTQLFIPFSRGASPTFIDGAGTTATGTIYPAFKPSKRAQEFQQRYHARFGKDSAVITAATAYDMTTLVLEAIRNGATTSDQIHEYILNMKPYDGYANAYEYNPNHHLGSEQILLLRMTGDGETEIVT